MPQKARKRSSVVIKFGGGKGVDARILNVIEECQKHGIDVDVVSTAENFDDDFKTLEDVLVNPDGVITITTEMGAK